MPYFFINKGNENFQGSASKGCHIKKKKDSHVDFTILKHF